jgi:putative transposase
VLVAPIEARLKEIIIQVCQEHQAEIEELEVMPDHVQRYDERRPTVRHSSTAEADEGTSSRQLRQEFPELKRKLPSLWTNSYFVSTTGGASLSIVKQYIEQQKHV